MEESREAKQSLKQHTRSLWIFVLASSSFRAEPMKSLMVLFHQTALEKLFSDYFFYISFRKIKTYMIKKSQEKSLLRDDETMEHNTSEWMGFRGPSEWERKREKLKTTNFSKTFSFISFQWLFHSVSSSWNFSASRSYRWASII